MSLRIYLLQEEKLAKSKAMKLKNDLALIMQKYGIRLNHTSVVFGSQLRMVSTTTSSSQAS